jgi:hypothetical protein
LMEAHIHSGEAVAMEYLQTRRNGLEVQAE